MAFFVDDFPDAELMEVLGDDAVFHSKNGGSITLKVIFDKDVERMGADALGVSIQNEIEYLKSEIVDSPLEGSFVVGSETYKVKEIISDDNDYIRVAVK